MKQRSTLSNEAYRYITSQHMLYNKKHVPMIRKRMKEHVGNIFTDTFSPILKSKEVTQEFKNELFNDERIEDFLSDLIGFDPEGSLKQEQNKQQIAFSMLRLATFYLGSRYKDTVFVEHKITEFKKLIEDLIEISQKQIDEIDIYDSVASRSGMKLPPAITPQYNMIICMCKLCWSHHSEPINKQDKQKVKDKTIKKIRHKKKCGFDKNQIDRCIEAFYPPN